jgi:hypothetical protein
MAWMLYAIAIFYGYWVNRHFGWNWYPANDAELVADGIGLLLVALAVLTSAIERNVTK